MFDSIYDALVAWHETDQATPKAVLAGLMVSVTSGIVGCLVILRRTAFLADAVSHAMLAGVVAGYLLMIGLVGVKSDWGLLGSSLVAGLTTVLLVGAVVRYSRVKEDTAIGVMYASIFALGGVLHSLFNKYIHVDIVHFIQGQLLAVSHEKLWLTATVCGGVLLVFVWFYRPLQLVSFDPVMAASLGVPVTLIGYVLTVCTSLVVVAGVNLVGVILVVGMLIIPAATAYLLADRLPRMMTLAGLFGATGFLAGFGLARLINSAPGPSVVLATGFQFGLVFAVAPRYGLLAELFRRRGQADLPIREDLLRALGRDLLEDEMSEPASSASRPARPTGGRSVSVASLAHGLGLSTSRVRASARRLARQGLLTTQPDGGLGLTESGRHEARRLIRAHRLWETYLERVGTDPTEIHARAHDLEHVNDPGVIDYLDHTLGHPHTDPHGSTIPPGEPDDPTPGVPLTLLRPGQSGRIVSLGREISSTPDSEGTAPPRSSIASSRQETITGMPEGFELGTMVTLTERREEGAAWSVMTPSGQSVSLSHQQADQIRIEPTT